MMYVFLGRYTHAYAFENEHVSNRHTTRILFDRALSIASTPSVQEISSPRGSRLANPKRQPRCSISQCTSLFGILTVSTLKCQPRRSLNQPHGWPISFLNQTQESTRFVSLQDKTRWLSKSFIQQAGQALIKRFAQPKGCAQPLCPQRLVAEQFSRTNTRLAE